LRLLLRWFPPRNVLAQLQPTAQSAGAVGLFSALGARFPCAMCTGRGGDCETGPEFPAPEALKSFGSGVMSD
jgi:hypothetical protein